MESAKYSAKSRNQSKFPLGVSQNISLRFVHNLKYGKTESME